MVTLTTGIIFTLFTCMQFWERGMLLRWFACAPTAYEVVRDCLNFEEHRCRWSALKVEFQNAPRDAVIL
jgi:hypothetical protein